MLILHFHHHEITTNRTSSVLIDLGEQKNIEIDFQAEDYDGTVSKSAYSIADIQDLGCLLGQQLSKSQQLTLYITPLCLQHIEAEYWIKWLSFGLALANYRYQHQPTATISTSITQYQLETSNTRWQQAFNEGKVLALSQLTARELINKPGNVLYPESFVSAVEQLAISGVTLSVLDDITMQEQGFAIDPWYQDILASDYADYRHGGETPDGSPCVAATFLAQFIQLQQKWIHIDCAAMTFQPQRKLYSKASTGFGTLLLTQLCEHIAQDNI
ncbi:hypothetical protein [Photobacterium damselae]|uniref:hypothetical protein n=1 Tax=Photobacterium damselae TaxID=38293 RepID=UPI002F401C01